MSKFKDSLFYILSFSFGYQQTPRILSPLRAWIIGLCGCLGSKCRSPCSAQRLTGWDISQPWIFCFQFFDCFIHVYDEFWSPYPFSSPFLYHWHMCNSPLAPSLKIMTPSLPATINCQYFQRRVEALSLFLSNDEMLTILIFCRSYAKPGKIWLRRS